ncbi:MAG: DHH family phosphoesterase, partial [Burkholderiaceae bacterium]|nr:DHH family phosphoesterase [Burkholderiaceae bacterium]
MTRIATREYSLRTADMLSQQGVHPVLSRIFAARGVHDMESLSTELGDLLAPSSLPNTERAAILLADAIQLDKKICIVADYDCDGATACAVAILGLGMMGARTSFLVPNRFEDGYGLTPAIVDRVQALHAPDVLVTVDNGIASLDGIGKARAYGMDVLVTDHHLPGETLPENCVIVNPNLPFSTFPSRNLAGVGVIFYVMLALRAVLRERGIFDHTTQPRLGTLLDLVALG